MTWDNETEFERVHRALECADMSALSKLRHVCRSPIVIREKIPKSHRKRNRHLPLAVRRKLAAREFRSRFLRSAAASADWNRTSLSPAADDLLWDNGCRC